MPKIDYNKNKIGKINKEQVDAFFINILYKGINVKTGQNFEQEYLPEPFKNERFYIPTKIGKEEIAEFLNKVKPFK